MADEKVRRRGGSYIRQKDGTRLRRADGLPPLEGRKTFAEAVDQTLADDRFSAGAVFDRIKETIGCESDAQLAWWFGTSPQSISNRRKRNAVPYREAVFMALWAKVPLDYLLLGVMVPAYRQPWERADHELVRGILSQAVAMHKGTAPLDGKFALQIAKAYERAEAAMVEFWDKDRDRLSGDKARIAALSMPNLFKTSE